MVTQNVRRGASGGEQRSCTYRLVDNDIPRRLAKPAHLILGERNFLVTLRRVPRFEELANERVRVTHVNLSESKVKPRKCRLAQELHLEAATRGEVLYRPVL